MKQTREGGIIFDGGVEQLAKLFCLDGHPHFRGSLQRATHIIIYNRRCLSVMENTHGSVSINTENIFPIIKKWLYSEKDIFIREIVSNAGDAISKLRKLANIGEAEIEDDPQWKIEVIFDKDAGTLTVTDNGIGMTAEEVDKYINQIAFSGAKDFIVKPFKKEDVLEAVNKAFEENEEA